MKSISDLQTHLLIGLFYKIARRFARGYKCANAQEQNYLFHSVLNYVSDLFIVSFLGLVGCFPLFVISKKWRTKNSLPCKYMLPAR